MDKNGDAVGIMTLRYVGTDGTVRGISYAIPSNAVNEYLQNLTD